MFNIDERVECPVPLPDAVLEILRKDPITAMCPDGGAASGPIASWFEASKVTLRKGEVSGLLVKPTEKSGCLMGANMGPFWLFRRTRNGYQLILSESGLGLSILDGRKSAYSDIELGAAVQAGSIVVYRLYRFRSGRYNLVQRREEDNE